MRGICHFRGGAKLMGQDPGLGYPFMGKAMTDNEREPQKQGSC